MSIDVDAYRARAAEAIAKAERSPPPLAHVQRSIADAFNMLAQYQLTLDEWAADRENLPTREN
jgi:hypothetical protein